MSGKKLLNLLELANLQSSTSRLLLLETESMHFSAPHPSIAWVRQFSAVPFASSLSCMLTALF